MFIEMANHFDDTDGDSGHTYSLENAPLWVEIDPDTGVISIKLGAQVPSDASMQGPYVMTVSINYHEGGTATKTVTLNAINTGFDKWWLGNMVAVHGKYQILFAH